MGLLRKNSDIKNEFQITVKNKFEALQNITIIEQQWENLRDSITQAAQEVIPKQQKKAKKKWMTEEILNLMEQRRKCKENEKAYVSLHAQITTKCKEAKEKWLKDKCELIEQLQKTNNSKRMHDKIKEVTNWKKSGATTGCIKAKDGSTIMEKGKIMQRWSEYIKDLYDDKDREDNFDIGNNNEGPAILKEEVEHAMKKMRKGKSSGPDNIPVELYEALEDFGVEKLTILLNRIYNSGKVPEDLLKTVFIALPKKPGATECGQHRTISLMSHLTKILLRIIMLRIRNKIKPEISEEQCGFVEGKGTSNATYILRNIIERSIEVQQDLYFCFIDYTKAFDTVKHQVIMKMLKDINIDGKDLRIIRNLYWQQSAAIRIDNEIGEYQPIKRGVRQGCVLSPDLFSLYSENIMRTIQDLPGISIGGYNINNLRYADDTVLIANSEVNLQKLVSTINTESERLGLTLNKKKTEVMVISKKPDIPNCRIVLGNEILKQVHNFKYLGSWVTSDGKCETDIKARIAMARTAFTEMRNILTNKKIAIDIRLRTLSCYILPILMYGCESWTITNAMEKRINAAEMWFLRRMLCISYTDRITNEEVLQRTKTKRTLLKKIRKQQSKFFGHIMRRETLEHLVTTGKLEGKRSRGRQRMKMIDGITSWLETGEATTTIRRVRDRDGWRDMIAHAERQGT